MPMLLHHSGDIDEIVARVKRSIDRGEDLDKDGEPDITMQRIDAAVHQVLEEKVKIGLLKKADIARHNLRPQTVYKNNSREYLRRTLHKRR